jgi:hypothetical protein
MTPEQTRIRTKLANLQRENLHRNCEVELREVGPHWGLYCNNPKCRKHRSWISWVKQDSLKNQLKKSAIR